MRFGEPRRGGPQERTASQHWLVGAHSDPTLAEAEGPPYVVNSSELGFGPPGGLMLRLSKKADYALMAMRHLALPTGSSSTSAREIAEQYDIPIELMAKVLQRLVRVGLLISTQGTRGGYTLSRPSASISLGDVIQAIDGPFSVTACSSENSDCEQYSKCSIRDPLWQIRERIAATLGTVTIAEMAAEHDAVPVPVAHAAVIRR